MLNNSKCKTLICCFGCISCIRDTDAEIKEHQFDIEHNINNQIEIPQMKTNEK
jgi:hypothetical protein